MRYVAPPKFKILVANLAEGSDPSRNTGGNPVKLRTGFELQMVQTEGGVGRMNGATQSPPPVSAAPTDHTVSIQVTNPSYWDATATPPGPFYYQDEVRVYDQYPMAAVDFGVGQGSNVGPVATIATSLADWVNKIVEDVAAIAVADTVYLSPTGIEALFPVQGTSDQYVLLGFPGPVFTLRDNLGNVLNPFPNLRAVAYVPKLVKSQSAPGILP